MTDGGTDGLDPETFGRAVLERGSEATIVFDPDRDEFLEANARACELLDYDRAELLATGPSAIHPHELARFEAFVDAVYDDGEAWTDGLRCRCRGGDEIPVEVTAGTVVVGDREVVLASLHDRRPREAYLTRLENLAEGSTRLLRASTEREAAEATVELARDALGQSLAVVWSRRGGADGHAGTGTETGVDEVADTHDPPGDDEADREAVLWPLAATTGATSVADEGTGLGPVRAASLESRAFRADGSVLVENYASRPDGSFAEVPLGATLLVPLGEHGLFSVGVEATGPDAIPARERYLAEFLGGFATATFDRLAREAALRERERALERQNERLEAFASVVTHDLRNPLSVARGYAELVDDEDGSKIVDALDRMDTIVDDVRALSRGGRAVDATESVRLDRLAADCWGTVDTADATLRVETDLVVRADRERLRRLFENLVRNSVEHAGPDVTVTVRAVDGDRRGGDATDDVEGSGNEPVGGGTPGDGAETGTGVDTGTATAAAAAGFAVEDDGPGIPADERADVFDWGHTTAADGTGLGLAIVREIAVAHGWGVDVATSPDGGARVEFLGVERA